MRILSQESKTAVVERLTKFLNTERWELVEILAWGLHHYARCQRKQRELNHQQGNAEILLDIFDHENKLHEIEGKARDAGWERE